MSALASCGRLPATVPDLTNRPRQLVFLTPINSQLNDFLNEIHQIARLEPSIVDRIDEDLDLHAKKNTLQRLIDAQFLAGQTPDCSVARYSRKFSHGSYDGSFLVESGFHSFGVFVS